MLRLHWPSILILSIVFFFFRNEIVETFLVPNLIDLSLNVFHTLLMFKLIKGSSAHQKTESTKESLITKMDCELKSKSAEIQILKRYAVILNEELEAIRLELGRYMRKLEVASAGVKLEIHNLQENLEAQMVNIINSNTKEVERLEGESKALMTVMKNEMESNIKEMERLKCESDAKTSELENDVVLKSAEIEHFKTILATSEAEWKSRLEDAVKSTRMEAHLKVSQLTKDLEQCRREGARCEREVGALKEKLEAIKAELDRFKRESDATTSRMSEMQNEIKSNAEDIEAFKAWKTDAEWKFRIIQLENEETSAKIDTKPKTIEIRAMFTEISKVTVYGDYSQAIEVAGVEWKLGARKSLLHNGVAFCLNGEKNNAFKWTCRVLVEFRLISQKSTKLDDVRRMELIHDAKIGYRNFTGISFKDLLDEEKGYVQNDSIDVDVVIRVFPIN